MLTDAFFRRYEDVTLFTAYSERERRFLGQASSLLTEEVFVRNKTRYKEVVNDPFYKGLDAAHKKIARELGLSWLIHPQFTHKWNAPDGRQLSQNYGRTMDNKTVMWLTQVMPETSSPDLFIKFRISFIEVAMQERADQIRGRIAALTWMLEQRDLTYSRIVSEGSSYESKEKRSIEAEQTAFASYVYELNERFRQARIPLSYHNDLIQMSDDTLLEGQVERPFWSIVSQPKWQNVDQLVKEAIDKRDRSERDAVTPAMQALESVIKIISADKGWDTGNEKGAANYINNLVAARDGVRFIEVWEKDALMDLFGKIRNHFGHGPGIQPLPTLRPQQTDWAIDTAMVWIKSLVRRL